MKHIRKEHKLVMRRQKGEWIWMCEYPECDYKPTAPKFEEAEPEIKFGMGIYGEV